MTSEHVIHVNEEDFEYQVLAYSQNIPVLVDFWAEWCKPCKILSPLLEKMADDSNGAFRLAKVDVDFNKKLSIRYGIRSIPTVKAFMKGQVTAEFTGLQTEFRLREFIRAIVPSPADLQMEKAQSLIQNRLWSEAESSYREALQLDPDLAGAKLGLARCLLARGEAQESLRIIRQFPASREFSSVQTLAPLAEMLSSFDAHLPVSDEALEVAMWNCIRLIKRGNIPAALDGLLDILRQNKRFRDGGIRQLVLAILEVMGDEDPDTQMYRKELASILF